MFDVAVSRSYCYGGREGGTIRAFPWIIDQSAASESSLGPLPAVYFFVECRAARRLFLFSPTDTPALINTGRSARVGTNYL